jgi:hypothetical protein
VRDFVVTLHSGKKYTVRDDRLAFLDHETLGLVIDAAHAVVGRGDDTVAMFDRRVGVSAVAPDLLVGETVEPDVVKAVPDADIPF